MPPQWKEWCQFFPPWIRFSTFAGLEMSGAPLFQAMRGHCAACGTWKEMSSRRCPGAGRCGGGSGAKATFFWRGLVDPPMMKNPLGLCLAPTLRCLRPPRKQRTVTQWQPHWGPILAHQGRPSKQLLPPGQQGPGFKFRVAPKEVVFWDDPFQRRSALIS